MRAHAHSSTSVFKTTTVFFSGKYGFSVLPLSLQSAIYSCPHRASRFLESVVTTQTTTTLAYNTQHTTKFLAIQPSCLVPCLTLENLATTLVYLAIYGCCRQRLLCHHSCACTCLNHHKFRTTWACTCLDRHDRGLNDIGGIPCIPTQLCHVYLHLPLTSCM